MGIHRGDDGVEFIVLRPGETRSLREVMDTLKAQSPINITSVVYCKDCDNCFELAETDPLIPYQHRDGADGFFCTEFDMDFYTPHYNAATFFCADGKRRDKPCT